MRKYVSKKILGQTDEYEVVDAESSEVIGKVVYIGGALQQWAAYRLRDGLVVDVDSYQADLIERIEGNTVRFADFEESVASLENIREKAGDSGNGLLETMTCAFDLVTSDSTFGKNLLDLSETAWFSCEYSGKLETRVSWTQDMIRENFVFTKGLDFFSSTYEMHSDLLASCLQVTEAYQPHTLVFYDEDKNQLRFQARCYIPDQYFQDFPEEERCLIDALQKLVEISSSRDLLTAVSESFDSFGVLKKWLLDESDATRGLPPRYYSFLFCNKELHESLENLGELNEEALDTCMTPSRATQLQRRL